MNELERFVVGALVGCFHFSRKHFNFWCFRPAGRVLKFQLQVSNHCKFRIRYTEVCESTKKIFVTKNGSNSRTRQQKCMKMSYCELHVILRVKTISVG